MRTTTWAAGIAVLVAVGLTRAGDDPSSESYDLRGPAPKKAQVVVTKTTFKVTDAEVVAKAAGQTIELKQSLTAVEEEEVKILAVDGRQATKAQTRVLKEYVQTGDGDKKAGELEGEVILSERTGAGKWRHSLVDTRPTDKQKKELDKRVGPESQDELYPAGKVRVGHAWTVDAAALQRVFGGGITDLKGKVKMKFVRVEDVAGEPCAVIEASGTIRGVAKEDEGDMEVEMQFKGTTWRSLKTGLDVKDKAEGRIKMSGTVEMDGVKVEFSLDGPMTIESTSRLKAGKGE